MCSSTLGDLVDFFHVGSLHGRKILGILFARTYPGTKPRDFSNEFGKTAILKSQKCLDKKWMNWREILPSLREKVMKTRQEQIEEMLKDLNDIVIWSDEYITLFANDAEIDRILPTIYWLENELKEEKEKLAIDKAD
jgi:hypothetical protein